MGTGGERSTVTVAFAPALIDDCDTSFWMVKVATLMRLPVAELDTLKGTVIAPPIEVPAAIGYAPM